MYCTKEEFKREIILLELIKGKKGLSPYGKTKLITLYRCEKLILGISSTQLNKKEEIDFDKWTKTRKHTKHDKNCYLVNTGIIDKFELIQLYRDELLSI